MTSLAQKLSNSSFYRMCEFFAGLLVGFFLMPFVIESLGDRLYGLWILIGSFLGYYGLFDLGLTSAIQRYMSKAIGQGDKQEINIIFNTFMFLFLGIGALTLFITVLVTAFAPLVFKKISDLILFRQVMVILGLNYAINFPMRVMAGMLESSLRFDVPSKVELVKIFFRTVFVVIVLKAGYGILGLAVVNLTVNALSQTAVFIWTLRLNPDLVFSRELVDLQRIKSFFQYSFVSFIGTLAEQLRFNVSNFVIAGFLGLSAVTLYSVASRLPGYFVNFFSYSFGILTPVFSQYEGRGDFKSIRDKFLSLTKLSSYISIFLGAAIIIFGKAILERWVGPRFAPAYPLMILFCIPLTLSMMQRPTGSVLFGISKHKILMVTNLAEGVINLILALILINTYELTGVVLAMAIPMVITKLIIQPVYVCRVIKLSLGEYYIRLMGPIVLKSTAVILVLWLLTKSFILPNYFSIILLGSVYTAVFGVFVFFWGLDQTERGTFKKLLRGR